MEQIKEKESIGFEEIKEFFSAIGVEIAPEPYDGSFFNRVLVFNINDIKYRIVWFVNQCTLYIGDGHRAPQIPFRWLFLDKTFPLVGGNRSIAFSYTKSERKTVFDRLYPYEVFRIPLNNN